MGFIPLFYDFIPGTAKQFALDYPGKSFDTWGHIQERS